MMTPDELKAIRLALGLTQEAFAQRLGIHPRSVCGIERGEEPMRVVVANAARWLQHTGGQGEGEPLCPTCAGVGTVRLAADPLAPARAGRAPRRRCPDCLGDGRAAQERAA